MQLYNHRVLPSENCENYNSGHDSRNAVAYGDLQNTSVAMDTSHIVTYSCN